MAEAVASASEGEDSDGDIRGIIEADGLALEDVPLTDSEFQRADPGDGGPAGRGWRLSVLALLAPRPAVVEDEDGDLVVARELPEPPAAADGSAASRLAGGRFELRRIAASSLARVGLQLWAGALVLSDLLLARPELVAGKRVCELGAGLGLCSMVAARLGAASVLCSDGSAEAVMNCEENLRRNSGCDQVCSAVVSWEDPPLPPPSERADALVDTRGRPAHAGALLWGAQVLLAADVIYDVTAAEALVALLALLLRGKKGNGKAEALYLALEKRVYFSAATLQPEVAAYPQFVEDCQRHGLAVTPIDLTAVPVHFDYVRSRFYELVVVTVARRVHCEEEDSDARDCHSEAHSPDPKRIRTLDSGQ